MQNKTVIMTINIASSKESLHVTFEYNLVNNEAALSFGRLLDSSDS